MGLKLASIENTKNPYYIDILGIHIYSAEELFFIIYEHPLLVMEDFINEPLIGFIKNELYLASLAAQIDEMKLSGDSDDSILFMMLESSDLYTFTEISRYRDRILSLRKLRPSEYMKKKADYMFELKRYGKAIYWYEKIIKKPLSDGQRLTADAFLGSVYNNLGSAYANLFLFEKAYNAYDMAYRHTKDDRILKHIFFVSHLEPTIQMRERYQSLARDQIHSDWEHEYRSAMRAVETSDEIKDIDEIFQKDSIMRRDEITSTIENWKQNYRNMI